MDLSTLKQIDTTTIDILHPKAQTPTGIKITLYSQDSEAMRKIIRESSNKKLKLAQSMGRLTTTVEEREEESLALLVAATTAWEGIELDGKPLECTPVNVRTIYADPAYAWLKKQVDNAFGDTSRFFA